MNKKFEKNVGKALAATMAAGVVLAVPHKAEAMSDANAELYAKAYAATQTAKAQKTETAITAARKAIDPLEKINELKSKAATLNAQVDAVEKAIVATGATAVKAAKTAVATPKAGTQAKIDAAYTAIKPLNPSTYYTSDKKLVDSYQKVYVTAVTNAVDLAISTTATAADITKAKSLVADLKKAKTASVVKTANSLSAKLSAVIDAAPSAPVLNIADGTVAKVVQPVATAVDGVTFTYDLTNVETGAKVPYTGVEAIGDGTYKLVVTATKTSNNKTATTTVNFTVDTKAPVLSIDQKAETVGDADYKLAGTVEAGATVKVNDADVSVVDGKFEATVTLKEGENTITVVATDKAGNQATATKVVTYDVTAPEAPVIDGVVEGDKLNKDVTPTVEAVDGVTFSAVLEKDGVAVDEYKLGAAVTAEGNYKLTVTATKDLNKKTAVKVVSFAIDKTAPAVDKVEVATGAKALIVTLKEKVVLSTKTTLAAQVKKDDTLIDFGTPTLSEDGLQVTIPVKDGKTALVDAKYDVALTGLADLFGNEIGSLNVASVTKKSVASVLNITSAAIAPTTNQTINYEIADNYGQVYTDATTIGGGSIIAATATVKSSGLPLAVTITDGKTATFDATGLKKDTVVVTTLTYKVGTTQLTATKELTVGDASAVASIKDITISNQVDASTNPIDTSKDGFVYGKLDSFKLTANLLDQYGAATTGNNVVTWTTSNINVLAFNASTATVLNNVASDVTIKVKGQGTAVISAYLANGSKVDYTVTVTLAGVKAIAATNASGAINYEDKEITTGFTFTDTNDLTNTLKPQASDVTFAFKSGTNLTASNITLSTLANTDGSFKGLKVNANKAGVYTITMSYAGKTADFTVTSAARQDFASLQNISDFTAKAGAPESKFTVKATNKYGEELDVKYSDLQLTWYGTDGKVADVSSVTTVKYYKADGTETTTPTDVIKSIGVSYTGNVATNYILKVALKDTLVSDTANVTASVATLKTVQINKGVVASDKLIAGDPDTKSQYIDLTLRDNDGDAFVDKTGLNVSVKDTSGNNYGVQFASIKYKHVANDGTVSYDDVATNVAGVALKLDPSTASLADGTYSIFVDKGTAGNDGYIKSNTVTVVVDKARTLDSVSSVQTSVTATLGTQTKVLVVPKDQYGDAIMLADPSNITLKDTPATVKIADNGVVEKYDSNGKFVGYEVTLDSIAKGTETVTVNVKFSDTVTKTINFTSTVESAGSISSITFSGDADNNGVLDNILHDTVIGTTDTYNTITLGLTGYDVSGNAVTIKASDFTWDESALPSSIVFDETTGTFSVDTSKLAADKSNDATGTVKAYQAGKLVGTITVSFTDAEPVVTTISFKDADKIKELAANATLDLSTITLNATTNFGDAADPVVKASDIANWNTSDSSIATVSNGTVTVSANAKSGDTVVLTGSYQGKLITFTVKVK